MFLDVDKYVCEGCETNTGDHTSCKSRDTLLPVQGGGTVYIPYLLVFNQHDAMLLHTVSQK
jgi:hypothetical protein